MRDCGGRGRVAGPGFPRVASLLQRPLGGRRESVLLLAGKVRAGKGSPTVAPLGAPAHVTVQGAAERPYWAHHRTFLALPNTMHAHSHVPKHLSLHNTWSQETQPMHLGSRPQNTQVALDHAKVRIHQGNTLRVTNSLS